MASHLTLVGIDKKCSLSCEITCDFEQGGELTTTYSAGSSIFGNDSGKLKIHYGKEIYTIVKMELITSKHNKLYGGRVELLVVCQKVGGGSGKMRIFLPLSDRSATNKNGVTIMALTAKKPTSKTVADFERIFPLDTPYIMYTTTEPNEAGVPVDVLCVLISEANIVINTTELAESETTQLDMVDNDIKYTMKNMTGIKKGPVGANRIETIECLPINDNGILLTDVEKGLGDSNITSRFNFNEIIARALKIPALRIIGGAASVIVFYKIMSMMTKKKHIGLKNMSEI